MHAVVLCWINQLPCQCCVHVCASTNIFPFFWKWGKSILLSVEYLSRIAKQDAHMLTFQVSLSPQIPEVYMFNSLSCPLYSPQNVYYGVINIKLNSLRQLKCPISTYHQKTAVKGAFGKFFEVIWAALELLGVADTWLTRRVKLFS